MRNVHTFKAWEDLNRSTGHLAWNDGWKLPGISAWALMHHLCVANDATGYEFVRPVSARDMVGLRRSFLDMKWLAPAPPSVGDRAVLRALDAIHAARPDHFVGSTSDWLLQDERTVTCEACAALGFHSPLHQMVDLVTCPWHGAPLNTGCLQCGKLHPPHRMLRAPNPFRCTGCKQPLLQPPRGALPAGWLAPAEALVTWAQQVDERLVSYSGALGWRGRANGRRPSLRQYVLPMPDSTQACVENSDAPLAVTELHGDSWEVRAVKCPDDLHVLEGWLPHLHQERWPVWKAIRRYLQREIERAGHGCCLQLESKTFTKHLTRGGDYMGYVASHGCEVAQAYIWWLHHTCFPITDHRFPALEIHNQPDMPVRSWAHRLLACFHDVVRTMREALSHLNRSGTASTPKMAWTGNIFSDLSVALTLGRREAPAFVVEIEFTKEGGGTRLLQITRAPAASYLRHTASTCGLPAGRLCPLVPKYSYWDPVMEGLFPSPRYMRGRSEVPYPWPEYAESISKIRLG